MTFSLQTTVTKSQTQKPPEFVEVSPVVQSESEDLAHSPVSDESSASISTATPSDNLVANIDVNLVLTSESEAQEALKPSHKMEPEEEDDDEVQLEPGKMAEHPAMEDKHQENATNPDSEKKTDVSDEKFSPLSEKSALGSSSSLSENLVEVEPKEPVPLAVTQPCSELAFHKTPPSAPDPDILPKATHSSSQTKISDPLPVPKLTPALSVKQEQVLHTQLSTSNPFRIQKVKASGLKSFKGIFQETDEALDKEEADPLEKLEILSDTEEDCEDGALPDWLKENEYVTVGSNKHGTVRYIGPTDFADGIWVGVELDVPAGTLCVYCYQDTDLSVRPHFHLLKSY